MATPTPLWTTPPRRVPTATPTPIPTPVATLFVPPKVVAAAPGDQFQPILTHVYELPGQWSEVRTDSAVVFYDRTGRISVTISEQAVERWKYPNVYTLGAQTEPERPAEWDTWSIESREQLWNELAQEFVFSGAKHGIDYLNIVRWFFWGEVLVQFTVEVPRSDWEERVSIHDMLQGVLASFAPHDGTELFDETDVLALLRLRMTDRSSGIYGRDEVARARIELSCDEIFTDLLEIPVYLGRGVWQAQASTLSSTDSWQVFEPSGAIGAKNTNESVC